MSKARTKKIPLRTCIGCRQVKPKLEMIRIVKNKLGEVFIDPTSKASGRGAYICPDIGCFNMAIKRKSMNRALEIQLSEQQLKDLTEDLEKMIKERIEQEEAITS